MINGFSGELISHSYAELLLSEIDREVPLSFERRFVKWWRTASRILGPASSSRTVLDTAIVPLLQLLGHSRPLTAPEPFGFSGILPSTRCVLIAVPWHMAASTSWRDAIRRGTSVQARWAVICNGRSLRIVDCTRAWNRSAIEFDFDRLSTSATGIATLWTLANAEAMRTDGPASLAARVEQSDRHALTVCASLGDGVLNGLAPLAQSLSGRARATRHEALDQALTLVYRILFLLFAEARGLVPTWHEIYRDAYTMDALARRAARKAAPGLWKSLQAISRLAHAGCHAGDLTVTAFNGRLFSPRLTPLVERSDVPDAIVRDLLIALTTESTRAGRRRISYYDLGVEQLGSVYERVLECQPLPHTAAVVLERTSTRRKATGSFYTPKSLTELLVRRTLAPLVDGKTADDILRLRVLDPAMGSGAFVVAACRYLADCCEHAKVTAGEWHSRDVSDRDRATLRRVVAERCIYGVDLNPTAVQLARLSLWLTTLAAERPLTFLDHHIAAGNSLIGARLTDLSRAPTRSHSRSSPALPLFDDQLAEDVAVSVLPARLRIALEPSDSLEAVKTKERMFADLSRPDGILARLKTAADAWCGTALSAGSIPAGLINEWVAWAKGLPTTLPMTQLLASMRSAADVSISHAVMHWELMFPEVFFDDTGHPSASRGFDAIIGNPPWHVLRGDLGPAAEREASRESAAAAMRFFRASGTYAHQGTGHPNQYQLFVERTMQLTRSGGRIGLLLPSGIATDHGSAELRRRMFDKTTIDTWIGFDNRKRIFPIHRSVRFVVMSATNGGSTDTLRFRCGLTDPAAAHQLTDNDLLSISVSRLRAWDPDSLTVPDVTDAAALAILSGISDRVPVLSDAAGWNARFGRELNASDDRRHFRELGPSLMPIVEGKQLAPFQIDLSRAHVGIGRKTAAGLIDPAITFNRARIAYRDVASATNKLTLIAAMLPEGTVSTHTVFCLKTPLDNRSQWCLLALMNSLVANYLVRLHVTTHVTASLMSRLPMPRPSPDSRDFTRLVEIAKHLAATGIADNENDYAELNAIAARLYGISREQYAFILDTFPLISQSQRDICLSTFTSHNAH